MPSFEPPAHDPSEDPDLRRNEYPQERSEPSDEPSHRFEDLSNQLSEPRDNFGDDNAFPHLRSDIFSDGRPDDFENNSEIYDPFGEITEHRRPDNSFAVAALILPIVVTIAIYLSDAGAAHHMLTLGVIGLTAIFLTIDCQRNRTNGPEGDVTSSPFWVLMALLLFWMFAYPFVFYRRTRFGGSNYGWMPLFAMLFLFSFPVVDHMRHSGLPKASDDEVVDSLKTMLQKSFIGKRFRLTTDHREISFDNNAQLRICECMIHTSFASVKATYQINWVNNDHVMYQVEVNRIELPEPSSKIVVDELDKSVRESPIGPKVKWIDGHRLSIYDEKRQIQFCECTIHTNADPITAKFGIAWSDQPEHPVDVFVVHSEAPLPTERQVQQFLETLIRERFPALKILSIDGHQEVSYLAKDNIRQCRCTVHAEGETKKINFLVKLTNPAEGSFAITIFEDTLPNAGAQEIVDYFTALMKRIGLSARVKAIDGYRQISFDEEKQIRTCECTIHFDDQDVKVKYELHWKDRDKGTFAIQIQKEELPAADGKEVIAFLEKLFRETPLGPDIKSISDYKQISFEANPPRRHCRCKVKTSQKEITFEYMIEWGDSEQLEPAIRILPPQVDL